MWHRFKRSPWDAYLAISVGIILTMIGGDPIVGLIVCTVGVSSWLAQRWIRQQEGDGMTIRLRINIYHLFALGVLIMVIVYALGQNR